MKHFLNIFDKVPFFPGEDLVDTLLYAVCCILLLYSNKWIRPKKNLNSSGCIHTFCKLSHDDFFPQKGFWPMVVWSLGEN